MTDYPVQPPSNQAAGPYPPPARRKNARILMVFAFVLVALVSCGIGAALGSSSSSTSTTTAARPAVTETVTAAPQNIIQTVTAAPKATAPAKPVPTPSPSLDDQGGDITAIVGEDIPAGVWTVHGAPSECYWKISRDGHPESIIDNNIGGGTQRVTLRKGQDFESQGCGVWKKS